MAKIPYFRKGHVRQAVSAYAYDPFVPQFVEGEIDGYSTLIETGKINMFDVIQSGKDDCDVYALIKRYNTGDIDALRERVGSFVDVTGVPNDVFSMKEYLNSVSAKFSALPTEVKSLYNNSPSIFFESLQKNGQENELRRIGDVMQKSFGVVSKPVVEESEVSVSK